MTLRVLSYFLQHHLAPQPARLKYVGANDELLLEDQMQRITLTGNISPKELVTGEGEEGEGERGRDWKKGKFGCSDLQVLLLVFWVRSFAAVSLKWRTTVLLTCLNKMNSATWKLMKKTSEEGMEQGGGECSNEERRWEGGRERQGRDH